MQDVAQPQRANTDCAMRPQETILQRLGKPLHAHWDATAHEPLPRRWIELIQHLNEQEQSNQSGNLRLRRGGIESSRIKVSEAVGESPDFGARSRECEV